MTRCPKRSALVSTSADWPHPRRERSLRSGRGGRGIDGTDPDATVPNAAWRKRIAAASLEVRSNAVFALVSESALIRGVLTALKWIAPPPYEASAFSSLAEAATWFTRMRGFAHEPFLPKLLEEARAQIAAPSRR